MNRMNCKYLKTRKAKGQALLIGILIVFMATVTLAIAAATIASSQIGITKNTELSGEAYSAAYSCLDDTLLRFSRGNTSTPPNLNIGGGTCRISITGSDPTYQILSVAEFNSPLSNHKITKKIQAEVNVSGGTVSEITQQEMYN